MKDAVMKVLLSLFVSAALIPVSSAASRAGQVSFGPPFSINNPDKKVSSPAAVIDDAGKIYAGWMREDGEKINIHVVSSNDGGKTFFAPVKVNGGLDNPTGLHASPSMALGPKGELYVAWTAARSGAEFAAEIRLARSTDGGATFAPSVRVNQETPPSSRGFESMAVGPDGAVYIVWLDGRENRHSVSSTYFARSVDGGKTFLKDRRIDTDSCPCCRTAVTVSPQGHIYAAWRKVFKGDIREIVVSRSTDGGADFTAPAVVGNDGWEIAGCPHRGPALAASGGSLLHVAWYTEGKETSPSVYTARSGDGGLSFSKTPLPWARGSFPDHPVMTLKNGAQITAWEETTPVLSKVVFMAEGDERPEQLNQGVRRAHDPVLSVNGRGDLLAGWVQEEIRASRFVFRLGHTVSEKR
ncbi:MAG: exo-alpha-sialidase [Deltaproteobacteria bacterium]|nr:exo-alpha-sialidase [Deltaproteobacteria bacterium]